ncbi:hypothetical protein LCGC14_1430840 [marine sediment metagenome]|uniref:Uncharacterized protein n=1 Tax=marine sediment metagenome TaxID=412755 RepID=A0A0F9JP06_9ZZZZ
MTIIGGAPIPLLVKGPVRKTITYAGGGTGANAAETDIFTVTGEVIVVALIPYCITNLDESAGTPTLALGVNNSTALFVAATTATAIDANDFWFDNSPTAVGGMAIPATLKDIAITDNISCLVGGTNNISAGVIEYTVYWLPVSSDGNVVAA